MHAATIGHMIGEEDEERHERRCKLVCPVCQGLMAEGSTVCKTCARKAAAARQAEAAEAERLVIRRERQVRFDAAQEAGWSLGELYSRHTVDAPDPLPTAEEICRRSPDVGVRYWPEIVIRLYCQGMGD